ncbi:MAG: hypothetical protein QM723_11220 [Myxococcaceae bacterium]
MGLRLAIVLLGLSLLAAKQRDTRGLSRDTAPQVDTGAKPGASDQAKANGKAKPKPGQTSQPQQLKKE